MLSQNERLPPWRERAFVSLAEAAAIAGRSYTWARNRTVDGTLEVRRLSMDGLTLVTVASLAKLIDEATRQRPPVSFAKHRSRRPSHLTLVVDNDWK
ncbi:MAG: hypothetical protein K2Z80_37520 [Xanthobacteraceae bacterium]|nr:hypothetical protein [Xanthobacteraceae bacterium]